MWLNHTLASIVLVGNKKSRIKMKTKRTFAAIAREIKQLWSKPYFGAVPYLDALSQIHSTEKNAPYLFETAGDLVPYLLANMGTFRGEDAKRIKAELKEMVK